MGFLDKLIKKERGTKAIDAQTKGFGHEHEEAKKAKEDKKVKK